MEKKELYVSIPVKEYRKLCGKVEKLKMQLKETTVRSENRYEWWQEEEKKRESLEQELQEYRRKIAELGDGADDRED